MYCGVGLFGEKLSLKSLFPPWAVLGSARLISTYNTVFIIYSTTWDQLGGSLIFVTPNINNYNKVELFNFITCLFWMLTKCSDTALVQADSSANDKNPNPRLFFFSWSYIITTSQTSPYLEKKLRKSVSVILEGKPPRNIYNNEKKYCQILSKCGYKFD